MPEVLLRFGLSGEERTVAVADTATVCDVAEAVASWQRVPPELLRHVVTDEESGCVRPDDVSTSDPFSLSPSIEICDDAVDSVPVLDPSACYHFFLWCPSLEELLVEWTANSFMPHSGGPTEETDDDDDESQPRTPPTSLDFWLAIGRLGVGACRAFLFLKLYEQLPGTLCREFDTETLRFRPEALPDWVRECEANCEMFASSCETVRVAKIWRRAVFLESELQRRRGNTMSINSA